MNVDTETSPNYCQSCHGHNATHLCEDCGAALCIECIDHRTSEYYFCGECHYNMGPVIPGQMKPEKCPECESEEISQGRRVEDICPRCRSTKLVSVEDRRKELAQELRKSIMTLQYGHTKLREFIRHLTNARHTLVSLRMAKFLHYRWLEEQIEAIQDELPALKNRIVSQAEIVARQMSAETNGLMDYPSWTAEDFPFITGVTNRLKEMGIHFKRHVDETLNQVSNRLKELRGHIEGLDYYRHEFQGFYDHSNLEVGEFPVCAFPEVRLTGSDFLKHDKATGTLYITSRRLVFIAETGTFRKKTEVIFDFPLLYLNGLEEDGRFRKRLLLRFKQGDIKIVCTEQTQKVLPDYLEIAKKFEKYIQTDMQRVRRLETYDINASDARLKIDELVYQLLSRDRYGPPRSRAPQLQTRQHMDWYKPPVTMKGSPPLRYDSFREELDDIIDRTNTWGFGPSTPPQDIKSMHFRRSIHEVENEINETIRLLRNGLIIPSEFVRRYRGLMREQYRLRRQGAYMRTPNSHFR